MTNTKHVKDLEPGDRVLTDAGLVEIVVNIEPGWSAGTRFVDYESGLWSCLANETEVELATMRVVS